MTDKAYIVANKQQEFDVLNKFEQNGMLWNKGEKPTDWLPSEKVSFEIFPYTLIEKGDIVWSSTLRDKDRKIVYDGRKEENVYKVTQEFINELIKWRDNSNLDAQTSRPDTFVDGLGISEFPEAVENWWVNLDDPIENNNRLIAIIQWLNGEDVFEVEEPYKFVVRSENVDEGGHYGYVAAGQYGISYNRYYVNEATKFNTREEAQEWANSHQVVVEIDEDGNEVE